jgi:trans-aconitate 2-methyltransferase
MNSGPREWDAEVYDRVSDIQVEWSHEVVERLALAGHETVLDAGCGSGRVTENLVPRLPRGRVIAVDASEAMVEKARERLGPDADVRVADLAELDLGEQVDAIFSNAVFHWVPDHDRLFARLHATLEPGGRLVAQCGGKGNVASLRRVMIDVAAEDRFAPHFGEFKGIWNFQTAEATEERLRAAGFEDVDCWLQEKLVRPEEPLPFLRTVSLGPHLGRLPEELRDPFVEAVAEAMGEPLELDYVRLNINARRAASQADA